MEILSKEMQDIKKHQMETLELKNTITKLKDSMDGLHIRIKKKRKESVDLKIEQQKIPTVNNRLKRNKESLTNFHAIGVPEGEGEKRVRLEKYLEKQKGYNFP